MEADENRISHPNQGVVDLVIEQPVDSAGLHILQRTGHSQRQGSAAMPIRALGNPVGLRKDQSILEVPGGEHSLAENEDIVGIQPKIPLFFEKRPSRCIGGGARHHVPGDPASGSPGQATNFLGLEREEATVGHRAQGVGALGAFKAQTGSLAPRNHAHRHAPVPEHAQPGLSRLGQATLVLAALGQPDGFRRRNLRGVGHRIQGGHRLALSPRPDRRVPR